MHLNVNSLQNKVEEVHLLMPLFLTETKIDSSYPNRQFVLNRYNIYRNDRAKEGGGVMAYISEKLPSKKLSLPMKFKTLEFLVIESKFGGRDAVLVGLYRPPKSVGKNYYTTVANEPHGLIEWVSLQKSFVIIAGDLNLDRLKLEMREGKIRTPRCRRNTWFLMHDNNSEKSNESQLNLVRCNSYQHA